MLSKDYQKNPHVKVYDVILSRNSKFSIIEGLLRKNVKKTTPIELHPTTVTNYGDSSELVEALGIKNTITAYVYLIDRSGKVRWKACGKATPEEYKTLKQLIGKLLSEKK